MGSIQGGESSSPIGTAAGRVRRRRLVRLVAMLGGVSLVATLVPLLAATTAGAAEQAGGSIVHVMDSDVWLTSPDGTNKARVTSDGATPSPDGKGSSRYSSPTQSDDGTIIVAERNQFEGFTIKSFLWVMNRRGEVLAKLSPPQFPVASDPACGGFLQLPRGIISSEVSPDGKKIVYESYADLRRTDCTWTAHTRVDVINVDGTGYTPIRRASDQSDFRLGDPTWVTSSRLLVHSDASDSGLKWVDLPDAAARHWTNSGATRDPDLAGDKLVTMGLFNASMEFSSANDGPPAAPTIRGVFSGFPDLSWQFSSPTWAPGGGALAWVEFAGSHVGDAPGEGIFVEPMGDLATFFKTARDVGKLIVPGGVDPYWGPAPVTLPTRPSPVADFDGNGTTDRSVYRNGAWHVEGQPPAYFGLAGDLPVPGSYDADLAIDRAVYRDGAWHVEGQPPAYFGLAGDIPVPGDYDGNGTTDRAVYRDGAWHVEAQAPVYLGSPGDIPVPGDYDGNGTTDRAVYRAGAWYVHNQPTVFFGLAGDIPVPGDFDGGGTTDRAVYRSGAWYVQGQPTAFHGLAGDVPVAGQYDSDPALERAVYRNGAWYVEGQPAAFFGLAGDVPLPLPSAIYRRFFPPQT